MREIKFRQARFKDGKFHHWHYWGYIGSKGDFVLPITTGKWRDNWEVKDSQEYIGLHTGPGLGEPIYEGDILSPRKWLSQEGNQLVEYSAGEGYAGFTTSGGLQFDECDEIIGNIHQTPELIPKIDKHSTRNNHSYQNVR